MVSGAPPALDKTSATDVQTPLSRSRPAPYYWLQLVAVEFHLEKFPHKFGLSQLRRPLPQNRTSADTDCNFNISFHKLHAFGASDGTHQCHDYQNLCPLCHISLFIAP